MTRDEFNTATSTTTTNTTNSTTQPYHRRNAERRLSAMTDDDDNDNNLNDKSRKFRWSSCFSFISTKFKKSKSPSHNKIRTSQSFEDFDSKKMNYVGPTDLFPEETIEVSETKPNCNSDSISSLWKQQQQTQQQLPPASLSPPPRHGKNKRDSHITSSNNVNSEVIKESTTTNQKADRRPILDPTLTPRVKPRSIKSKKQPSLLRLSLDAELLQQQQQPSSPDGVISLYYDNESISSTTAAHSSLSITPTSTTQYQPFRTGTLGMKAQNKLSFSSSCSTEELPPPLPPLPPGQQQLAKNTIPLKPNTSSSSVATERPLSTQSTMTIITSNSHISQQQQQQIVDSPSSVISTVTDDDELTETSSTSEKLTLKERRHRRSPLAMPDTEQLTLALKGLEQQQQQLIEQHDKKRSAPTTAIPSTPLPPITQLDKPRNRSAGSTTEQQESSSDEDDSIWRQQLLEQTLAFSFQSKSRQEAMLTLEGKKASPAAAQQQRAISLQPIVNVHKLADHFTNGDRSVVQDKAQYDAIVSRTRRASSTTQQSQQDNDFQLQQQQQQRKNYRISLRARSASDSSSSSSSFNNKLILQQQQQQEQLDIITENEVVHITSTGTKNNSSNKVFMNASVTTPETPPHHQLNAPSLISAPSTPNSIDSSVLDHDDYLNERLHNMTFVQSS